MCNRNDQIYFESPSDNAFNSVDYPYLKENYDEDPYNDIPEVIGAVDSVGNLIPGPNDYVPGTNIPRRDGMLNKGNGEYVGANEPYHDLEGNLDFSEFVDANDARIFCENWLKQKEPGRRLIGDLDNNGIVTFLDYNVFANQWQMEEPNNPDGSPKP